MPDAAPLRPKDPVRVGEYEILGLLGEGGQGAVYLGRRAHGGPADEYLAIKLLHDGLAADSPARARFVREVHVAMRVARFCTAQVLDADLIGDRPYIVSEYVEGPSLYASVHEQGPRTGGALERLAIGTLTALTAIHQAGITHRDFKPHNIVLGPDGPRVIDFGIARALGSASDTQTIGTPAYMAPEQFAGRGFGPPADMFAWASTMVFASTARPAFGNDDSAAVMHRIVTAEPHLGELTGALRDVVAACLAKDPEARPTAQDAQRLLMGTTDPGVAASGVGDLAAPGAWSIPADAFTGTPHMPAAHAGGPAPVHEAAAAASPPPGPGVVSDSPPREHPAGAQPPRQALPQGSIPPESTPAGPTPVGSAPHGSASDGFTPPVAHHTPVQHPPAYAPAQTTRPGPGGRPPARPRRRAALLAAGLSVAAVLAAGTAWAATRGGTGGPESAQGNDAAGPAGQTHDAGAGPTEASGEGAQGTRRTDPAKAATTSPKPGDDRNTRAPRPGGSTQPSRSTPRPTGGGGGGGDTPSRPNPYTAQQVCNSGGHGSGYYVQRSSAFTGGRVYQLYNSSGYNCVVTLKTADVGTKTSVWAELTREDGTKASDRGSFAYYAGPVFLHAKGQCVKYTGGGGSGSAGAPWGNCG
ncbi:serine/threonine protein kinase [Actinomadura alba]|uniref:non-specific serine/threonine protein kinase n=1 Tax=Actinomadura alba TaxID=406431 RepID=A0ABR7LLT8_9ACTN|nr:serine/threonine-protein kinase [Actinomadura alba]MBC6465705.1 protein kinase [Actinomadura alba]